MKAKTDTRLFDAYKDMSKLTDMFNKSISASQNRHLNLQLLVLLILIEMEH